MKTLLAFGDSLTWGADPKTGLRHPRQHRWPEVLKAELGSRVDVLSDGLGGRTTCYDDHTGPACRNGARGLAVALAVHKPVHGGRAEAAFSGMRRLAEIVETFPYKPRSARPRLMLVAPPPCVTDGNGQVAGGRSIAESQRLAPLYRKLASELGHDFFDAGSAASASPIDGVHMDIANTEALGRALSGPVADILG